MKVKLYGTGSSAAKNFSACAFINDEVLFDCPNGLVQKLRNDDVDFDKVKVLILSHFHGDHDFDVPFFLGAMGFNPRGRKLTIIAPKGFAKRHKVLCDMIWPGIFGFKVAKKNIDLTILEAKDKRVFNIEGYEIKAYSVSHCEEQGCVAYGFKITKDGKTISFSGDTSMTDNVRALVDGVDMAFIECTGAPLSERVPVHIDVPEFLALKKDFPDVKLVPIHMSDKSKEALEKLGVKVPEDGDEYN
ncbi:MAG: ribonuclease Z [Firmicutes bacterium]|nr:ribonuclease Z [Bacillota bacterium]